MQLLEARTNIMFLNNFAEPVALQYFGRTNLLKAENLDMNVPLLLSSATPTIFSDVPNNWSGCLYSTNRIIQECKGDLNKLKSSTQNAIRELEENEPMTIRLPDDTHVNVTAIPVTKAQRGNKVIFLIEDNYISRLCVNILSDDLSTFVLNTVVRKAIAQGIDLLHIDDTVYLNAKNVPTSLKTYPTDFQLRSLALLVRPIKVVGFHNAKLPEYIMASCCKPDPNQDELDYVKADSSDS